MSHFVKYTVPITDMALLEAALTALGIAHEVNVVAQGYAQQQQRGAVVIRRNTLLAHGAQAHYADLVFNADGMTADDLDKPRLAALLGRVQQEYTLQQAERTLQAKGYTTRRAVNADTGNPQVIASETRAVRLPRQTTAPVQRQARVTR